MPRRKPGRAALGSRIHEARVRRGLTAAKLAQRTNISQSSLSRFERDESQPSFADVCAIASALGWPLLYFATGRERTGDDERDLIAHLSFWGLDLVAGESPLIGEARPLEELVCDALALESSPRLTESVPALLLRNDFGVDDLIGQAQRAPRVVRRLGWAAELSEWIASQLSVELLPPSVVLHLKRLRSHCWTQFQAEQRRHTGNWRDLWDWFGTENEPVPEAFSGGDEEEWADRLVRGLPPITKKWLVFYDARQEAFRDRARAILGVRRSARK